VVNACKVSERYDGNELDVRIRVIGESNAPGLYPSPIGLMERSANQGMRNLIRRARFKPSLQLLAWDGGSLFADHRLMVSRQ
jgi:hypothetical protein